MLQVEKPNWFVEKRTCDAYCKYKLGQSGMQKTIFYKHVGIMLGIVTVLSACSNTSSFQIFKPSLNEIEPSVVVEETQSNTTVKPQNLGNITVADAAKVSDVELQEAVAKPVVKSERNLGKTIASLGLIDETGFWLRTPLVKKVTEGRIVHVKSGASVNLRLIPNGKPTGSGSQISIAAMQTLGIPIVELAEINVFSR